MLVVIANDLPPAVRGRIFGLSNLALMCSFQASKIQLRRPWWIICTTIVPGRAG